MQHITDDITTLENTLSRGKIRCCIYYTYREEAMIANTPDSVCMLVIAISVIHVYAKQN